ncbi:MAG: ArsR/SmtB family transcription factor [Thermodesulfobacteriota bacterium]
MDVCQVKCINEQMVAETRGSLPEKEEVEQMASIFKALSDPSRLKIVLSLLGRELCVCDIAAVCSLSDSSVSHQLRLLRNLKIVKNRRQGKIVYYTLDDDHVIHLIEQSLGHVRHRIVKDVQ